MNLFHDPRSVKFADLLSSYICGQRWQKVSDENTSEEEV
jgi:hypothetical protein